METSGARWLSAANARLSFLTEHDDTPMAKAKRSEFIRSVLRPASELTDELRLESEGLHANVRAEIAISLEGMRKFVAWRVLEGERRLQKAQQQLERQEREFRKDEVAKMLLQNIAIYEDRIAKMEAQSEALRAQSEQWEAKATVLSEVCEASNRTLAELARQNQLLQKSLSRKKPAVSSASPKPLAKLFDVVPFEVFLELSEKKIGQLSLAQVVRCQEFRKEVQSVRTQVTALREANLSLRTSRLQQCSGTLEAQFNSCLAAFGHSLRSFSSARELRMPFRGFPIDRGFETMLSSRLHTIQSARASLLKQWKLTRTVTKEEWSKTDPEDIVRLLTEREDCLERLLYFLRHPNPLRASEQSTVLQATSSLSPRAETLDTKRLAKAMC